MQIREVIKTLEAQIHFICLTKILLQSEISPSLHPFKNNLCSNYFSCGVVRVAAPSLKNVFMNDYSVLLNLTLTINNIKFKTVI